MGNYHGDDYDSGQYYGGQSHDDAFHNVETFEGFIEKVNAYTISNCGMSTDEFDDYHYRDCYDEGMDPEEAGDEAMANAGLLY